MSFTSISVIVLVIMALTVMRCSFRGYKKGLTKSLIGLSVTLFAAVCGTFISVLVVELTFDFAIDMIADMDFYEELIEVLQGLESVLFFVVKMLLSLVLYIPVFYLTRLIVNIPVSIIHKTLSAKKNKDEVAYDKEDEELYVKSHKGIAALVGALTGFVISIVTLTPMAGALGVAADVFAFAEDAVGEEVLEEDIKETFDSFSDDFSLSMVSACGGKALFDFATTVKIDGEYTNLNKELDAIADIDFEELGALIKFEGSAEENSKRIEKLAKNVDKSKLIKLMFAETLSGLSEAWLSGEEFLGTARPEFGQTKAVDSFIDELLYVCKSTTTDTIVEDITTLINIASLFMDEKALLEGGDYNEVVKALVDGKIIENVKEELEKNNRMRPVAASLDNMIMMVVAEEIQDFTKYSEEECDKLFGEITSILNDSANLTGTTKIETISQNIRQRLDEYGTEVPESLCDDIAKKLVEDIDLTGADITEDDIKDYFEEYINGDKGINDLLP